MDDLISKLSKIRSKYNCFDETEEPYYRALSTAIKKLSEQADGDTISRQEAIRIASGYCHPANIAKELAKLPSAQSEPQWIPCSERLPDSPKQVLVYARSVHYALAKYDEMREADGTYKKQWVTFDAWKPFYTIKEVIAWMPLPLPEPYKERREG